MEQLAETITLDVEESNELAFKIKIEGANSPAKVRLVCESPEISYMFSGRGTHEDGVVQFIIPQMKGKIQEGLYSARVEVLVENRYFSPVQFQMNFKKTMKVFAEAIQLTQPTKYEIKVSAAPMIVQQPKVEQKTVANQQKEYILENPFITPEKNPAFLHTENNTTVVKNSINQVVRNKQKTLREKFVSKTNK